MIPLTVYQGTQPTEATFGTVVQFEKLRDLAQTVKTKMWSPAVFSEASRYRRKNENFTITLLAALDVDKGITILQAQEIFKEFKHIILTTKSHQREKNGVVCDRFRVILFLSLPITDKEVYSATYTNMIERWPFIDAACRDAARFFYPGQEIVSVQEIGALIDPVIPSVTSASTPTASLEPGEKGELKKRSYKFLSEGAPIGSWHDELVAAVFDMRSSGYSKEEVEEKIEKITGHVDEKDVFHINDVFQRDLREAASKDRIVKTRSALFVGSFQRPSYSEQIKSYEKAKLIRLKAHANKIPFLCPGVERYLPPLTQGLVVIGAVTGSGKTTTLCNTAASFFHKIIDKKIRVISNEESIENIANYTGCILLKQNWHQFRRGELDLEIVRKIELVAKEILKRVEVVNGEGDCDMTVLENVIAVLEDGAKDPDIGLIMVDYLQSIAYSTDQSHLNPYEVSKALGHYLRDYGYKVPKPVIVFSQLRPKQDALSFNERILGDRTFAQHATMAFELIAKPEEGMTEVILHKDRFNGRQGAKLRLLFEGGRYVL